MRRMIIDGKEITHGIVERLKGEPKPARFFGAVLVGDDPASVNFLKQKEKVARRARRRISALSAGGGCRDRRVAARDRAVGGTENCGGFIVQLPLPASVNRHYAMNAIPRDKDVDFLSEAALGAFYTERSPIVPPSVGVVEEIFKLEQRSLRELTVVMVGAGFLIGKPIGFWLPEQDCRAGRPRREREGHSYKASRSGHRGRGRRFSKFVQRQTLKRRRHGH